MNNRIILLQGFCLVTGMGFIAGWMKRSVTRHCLNHDSDDSKDLQDWGRVLNQVNQGSDNDCRKPLRLIFCTP